MWQPIKNSQVNMSDTKSNLQSSNHSFVRGATHNAHQSRKQSLEDTKEASAHHSVCSRQKQFSDTNNKYSFNFDSEEFVNSARNLNKLSRSQCKKLKKLVNCDSENKNSDILCNRNKKDKIKSGGELYEKKNRKRFKKKEQESKITAISTEKTELTNHIIPDAKKNEGNEYKDRYFQYFALNSTANFMEGTDNAHQKKGRMSQNEYKCVDQNNGCSSTNKKQETYTAENKTVKSKYQSKVKCNKISKLKKRMNSYNKSFSRTFENNSAGQNDPHGTSTSSSCTLISNTTDDSSSSENIIPKTPPCSDEFHVLNSRNRDSLFSAAFVSTTNYKKKKLPTSCHTTDDSSSSENIILNTPPCSDEFHVLNSKNRDSLFSAAFVSTTNYKKKKLPTSCQKLNSEAIDIKTDRNSIDSTENSLKTEKNSAKSYKKYNKLSTKSRNCAKREKFTSAESESKTGSGGTDVHSNYLCKTMLDDDDDNDDGEHSQITEKVSTIPHWSKSLANSKTSSKSSKRKETGGQEKKEKSHDLYQPNSVGSKNKSSEMGTHMQHDQSLRLSHLTLEQIEGKFENNIQYLRDIFKTKRYCERHERFKKGGFESLNLRYSALFTVPYTDDQLYHLLFLICSTYCPRGNFERFYDYFMKVLLPEICIKIYMDEFSLSYDDALSQMESIPEEAIYGFSL